MKVRVGKRSANGSIHSNQITNEEQGLIMKIRTLTIIAAAVTMSTGVAYAQSGITVYGALDAGILSSSTNSGGVGYLPSALDAGSATTFKDGGIGASNLGLKGERNMGGGNRAFFQLQGNVNLKNGATGGADATGTTQNLNQMALVGLGGSMGEIKLGRQVSPIFYAMASTDVRQARFFGSALTALVGMNSAAGLWTGAGNAAFGTVYNDASVVYNSPKFNNASFSYQHAFGNVNGNNGANSQDSLTAQYSSNGLRLSALYYKGAGNNLATASGASGYGTAAAAAAAGYSATGTMNKLVSLGALYTWDQFSVSLATFKGTNPSATKPPVGSVDVSTTALGFGYKIAPNLSFTSGYYNIKDNTNAGNKSTQLALGLDYGIFKDVTVYVQTANTSNTGANMNTSPVFQTAVTANKDNKAWMTGMRYTF